jgi:hypothetical protein
MNSPVFEWIEYSYQYPDGRFDIWQFTHIRHLPTIRQFAEDRNLSPLRGVYVYERPDVDAPKTGDYHIDLDNSKNLEAARLEMCRLLDDFERGYGLDLYALRIGFSGSKGFNLIIPRRIFLKEEVIIDPVNVYKRFGEFLHLSYPSLDLGIYSKRRLWKMENSRHPKTGLYRIALKPSEIREMNIEQIKELAGKPRSLNLKIPRYSEKLGFVFQKIIDYKPAFEVKRIRSPGTSKDFSGLSPEQRIPKKYRKSITEGNRNHTICSLVWTLKRAGASASEIEEIVLAFNRKYCSPSKPEAQALIPVRQYVGGRR